ncbi:MAG: four helix bundle protein [Candidatus Nanoarchaeia archaeon]
MQYPLEERTANFGEQIIDLCKKTPKNSITLPIVDQLLRSALSIGANYQEANGASSKKDFKNKIFICKKECKETKYWLRMLARACEDLKEECRIHWIEAQELTKIFSKIAVNTK